MSFLERLFGAKKVDLSTLLYDAMRENKVSAYVSIVDTIRKNCDNTEELATALQIAVKKCGLEKQLQINSTRKSISITDPNLCSCTKFSFDPKEFSGFIIRLDSAVKSAYRQKEYDTANSVIETTARIYMDTEYDKWVQDVLKDMFTLEYYIKNSRNYCNVTVILQDDNDRTYNFCIRLSEETDNIVSSIQEQSMDSIAQILQRKILYGFRSGKLYQPSIEEIEDNLTHNDKQLLFTYALKYKALKILSTLAECEIPVEDKSKVAQIAIQNKDYTLIHKLLKCKLPNEDIVLLKEFYDTH